jgi:hypothetical protein
MKFEVNNTPSVTVPLNAQAWEWVTTTPYSGSVTSVDPNGATTDLSTTITGNVHTGHGGPIQSLSSLTVEIDHAPSDAPTLDGPVIALGILFVFGDPNETDPYKFADNLITVPIGVPVTIYPPMFPVNKLGEEVPGHLVSAKLTMWWTAGGGYDV